MRCLAEGNFPCGEKGIRPAGDFAADKREKGAFPCPAEAGGAGETSRRKDGAGGGNRFFCRFAGKELCKSDRIRSISHRAHGIGIRGGRKQTVFCSFGKAEAAGRNACGELCEKGAEGCFRFGGGEKNAFDGTRGEKADGG